MSVLLGGNSDLGKTHFDWGSSWRFKKPWILGSGRILDGGGNRTRTAGSVDFDGRFFPGELICRGHFPLSAVIAF